MPLRKSPMRTRAGLRVARRDSTLRRFLDSEATGGLLLIGAALLAILAANGPAGHLYHHLLHLETGPVLSPKLGPMSPQLWINDGLMAVFFLLVGLEIKREWVAGRLATWRQRRFPLIAAAGGMAVPALVYLVIAGADASLVRGWAIPAATDIAFAIGVLSLIGSRAPASLKLFLTTVAIVDDIGAVVIIALVYTAKLDLAALGLAAAVLLGMHALRAIGVRRLAPFLILSCLLWYLVLLSGVHATVAGVLAATSVPAKTEGSASGAAETPLHRLEHGLARWVAFLILPLFGFANAGISLSGMGSGALAAPLPLAVAAGLFLGKQAGIFGAILLCVRLGVASRPFAATWLQTYAVTVLCGIGFTMSLFIGTLAFPDRPHLLDEAKLGVLAGSLLSAVVGYLIFRFAPPYHGRPGLH